MTIGSGVGLTVGIADRAGGRGIGGRGSAGFSIDAVVAGSSRWPPRKLVSLVEVSQPLSQTRQAAATTRTRPGLVLINARSGRRRDACVPAGPNASRSATASDSNRYQGRLGEDG